MDGRGRVAYAFLGGALAWFLHLMVAYALAEGLCVLEVDQAADFPVTILSLGFVSIALFGAAIGAFYVAWRLRRTAITSDFSPSLSGMRFMAEAGMLSNALFSIIILLQSSPILAWWQGC